MSQSTTTLMESMRNIGVSILLHIFVCSLELIMKNSSHAQNHIDKFVGRLNYKMRRENENGNVNKK